MPGSRSTLTAGLLFVTGLIMTTMACASLFGAASNPQLPDLSRTLPPAPTATAEPLYRRVTLNASRLQEQGQPSIYTIDAEVPFLSGSDDGRVKAFNEQVKGAIDNAVATFKQNVSNLPANPNSTTSYLQLQYNLVSPPGDIFSIKLDMQTFYSGAAHPGDTSQTINFDLDRGQALALADLFLPGADYLGAISKYCIAQLGTRDIGFQGFELGATATLENYRNWNISADGLIITFDEYQVAPYAAGPQTVVIPYAELAQIIQPGGPLAPYFK